MADLDSRSKRASSVGRFQPWLASPVLPDGDIDQGDRQHTAFSYSGILATDASPPAPAPAPMVGAGRPSRERRRKVIIDIDGEEFIVSSKEEAAALLLQAQEIAEQKAVEESAKAAQSSQQRSKLVRLVKHKLKPPQITVEGPDDLQLTAQVDVLAQQLQQTIAELYSDAVRSAEIGILLRRKQDEDDEEDFVIGLLL